MSKPSQRGFFFGLTASALWLLSEAIWTAAHHDDVTAQVLPLHVGVAAPWIGLLALLSALAAWGLLPWFAAKHFSDEKFRGWLWARDTDDDERARSTAAVISWVFALGIFAAFSLLIGVRVLARVRTPALAVGLLLIAQFVFVAALALTAPTSARFFAAAVRRLPPKLARPVAPILLTIVLFCATFGFVWWHRTNLIEHLPWIYVFTPATGIAIAAALELVGRRSKMARKGVLWTQRGIALMILACGVWSLFAPSQFDSRRTMLLSHASVARTCLSLSRPLLDFDGDGVLGFYGEGDCAPFDNRSGPHQIEIPRNGEDEDCSGRDLEIGDEALKRGKPHHEKPAAIAKRPHIFLITTDALSFRHTNGGGYQRNVTPMLQAWSARATVFTRAFSPGPDTATSLPALFTGVYSSTIPDLHAASRRKPLRYPATLAQTLGRHGYDTYAVLGNDYFFPEEWPGITSGFTHVDVDAVAEASKRYSAPKPHTSPELTDHVIRYIADRKASPLFIWVHYFDHHPFYSVPRGEEPFGDGDNPLDRYDTELRFSDRHWGRLLAAIEETFTPDEYIALFTADHGEAFDANHTGMEHHAHCLRTEEVHVPFIVQTAAQRGRRVDGLVSLLDVVPTLVDIAGVAMPHRLYGESLVPVLFDGEQVEKNAVFGVLYDPRQTSDHDATIKQVSVRTPELLFIYDRQNHLRNLYRWPDDPLDRNDVSATEPKLAEWGRYLVARELRTMLEPLR